MIDGALSLSIIYRTLSTVYCITPARAKQKSLTNFAEYPQGADSFFIQIVMFF
jgi:hypothetical protein